VCDNFVLHAAEPSAYASTLLAIAESLSSFADTTLAPTLISSRCELESRITRLLNKGRNTMTRLKLWTGTGIALLFIALGLLMANCTFAEQGTTRPSTRGAAPDSDATIAPIPVKYELGQRQFLDGDNIVITDIHGTDDIVKQGNTYIIKGKYTLGSHDGASIQAHVTARNPAQGRSNTLKTQMQSISRGDGTFTLVLPMNIDGWPHVSFYPVEKGESFGGIYFGDGDTLLTK